MHLQTHFNVRLFPGVFFVFSVVLFSPAVLGQYAADLIGQQLERKVDAEAAIQDGVFGLLSSAELPSVESVTVSEAEPELLVLSVRSSPAGSFSLVARLLREDGRIETRIPDRTIPATGDDETTELRFRLPSEISEGTSFSTAYVSFQVQRLGRVLPALEWRYPLIKQWSKPIAPENVLIRITAEPIGNAARLPAVLGQNRPLPKPALLQIPSEVLKPEYKIYRKNLDQFALTPTRAISSATARADMQVATRARTASINQAAASTASAASRPQRSAQGQLSRSVDLNTAAALQLSTRQESILQSTQLARVQLSERHFKALRGLNEEERDRGAKGPSDRTIDLISVVHADADVPMNQILGIRRELYLDQNPESGVLYYVPRDYNLGWSPNEGFALKMLYAAVADGAPGQVMMALRLAAGVETHENALIHDLAEAYRKLHDTELKVDIVRPLPVTSQHPIVNLGDSLGAHFDIAADDLVATVFSDVLEEMEVAWTTDEISKQNIELALSRGIGISGDITFELESQPPASINVPARIRLADNATFGRIDWERSSPWRNSTPYPLQLKRIHALLFEDDTPIIYSWDLSNHEVPPRARVEWDAEHIPAWMDNKARRMWVEYAVVADCDDCNRQVMSDISYGASRAASRQEILIAALSPLDDIGAAELAVRLRSRYFDSAGESLSTLAPVIVNNDRFEYSAGLVYLVDRQPGEERAEDPLFEYQIEVVMPDGSLHEPPADRWIKSHRNRIVIGTVQVEQSLGYLPGAPQ